MNRMEFLPQNFSAKNIATIFKDWFEQHMLVYGMLKGIQFIDIAEISIDKASIMYKINMPPEEDKERILEKLNQTSTLIVYGHEYKPKIFMSGELLCITVEK